MSVVLTDKKAPTKNATADMLAPGTWFVDFHDEVYVVTHAYNHDKKIVVCLSDKLQPHLIMSPENILVSSILPPGTTLKIVDPK